MLRLAKQLIIAAVVVLMFGGLSWGVYRMLVVAPSCSDGIQNGAEEGVDCGINACSTLCATPIAPITVASTKFIAAGDGTDVLVELANPNPLYGAFRVPYTLVVYGLSGETIATLPGVTYVNPGLRRTLLFPLEKSADALERVDMQIDQAAIAWATLQQDAKGDIQFGIRGERLEVSDAAVTYQAAVLNKSKFSFDTVDVVVLLYDAKNVIVGANSTVQRTLVSGEERAFTMRWPFAIPSADHAEVMISTNIFANDNFLRDNGSLTLPPNN